MTECAHRFVTRRVYQGSEPFRREGGPGLGTTSCVRTLVFVWDEELPRRTRKHVMFERDQQQR